MPDIRACAHGALAAAAAAAVPLARHVLEGVGCDEASTGVITSLCGAKEVLNSHLTLDLGMGSLLLCMVLAAALLLHLIYRAYSKAPVYIVNFTVFKPPTRYG